MFMMFDCIEKGLRWSFHRYGRYVGKHPWPFLIIPILLAAALTSGVIVSFEKVIDEEKLYSPQHSQSRRNRAFIEDLYGVSQDMLARHQTRISLFGQLIVTSLDQTNVLRAPVLEEIIRLHETVMNISVPVESKQYTYTDLCLTWKGACIENEILSILHYEATRVESTVLNYPWTNSSDGRMLFIGSELGDVTLGDNGQVEHARALQLTYNLRPDRQIQYFEFLWEQELLRIVDDFQSDEVTIYKITGHSYSEELERTATVTFEMVSTAGLILLVICLCSTHVLDWVRTKPILTLLGILTAGFALGSTFGLFSYVGVPYSYVAGSIPFMILGIGVDDMFIMLAAWRRTDASKPTEDRLSETLEESAFSITITSLTDILAFGIGCISHFYSVQLLCLYAAVSLLFCYLYMITFFAGCMAIIGRREESNRHALTLRKVLSKHEAPSKAYAIFCAGGSQPGGVPRVVSQTPLPSQELQAKYIEDTMLAVFFQKYFGPFLIHPVTAAVTVLLYVVYILVAIWSMTGLREGVDLKNTAPDDSYLRPYYTIDDLYFRVYGPDMSIVAVEEMYYWNPDVQDMIEDTIAELESSEYFHDSSLTISWLREYTLFLGSIGITEPPPKDVFLRTLREKFLVQPDYDQFVPDIIFDEANESVVSSRFYVIGKDLNTTARERDMFYTIRQVLRDSPLDLVAYHAMAPFRLEQYISIRQNTIQILSIGIAVMFVVSLVLIPSPICAVLVTLSVISIVFGTIGYMALWNIALDSITMIILIPCLGFSVDFSAHIAYAYIKAPHDSSQKRSIHALYTLGKPILEGAISTISVTFILITTDSYGFRTFFKTMFLTISIGATHGIVFLPVFLSVIPGNDYFWKRSFTGSVTHDALQQVPNHV